MSVIDWEILNDIETAVGEVSEIKTVLTTVCEGTVDVPAAGFPAALVLWQETRERLSGADSGELIGRVKFVISVLVRDADRSRGLESTLSLANDIRNAVMADHTRSGLASATEDGAGTELGPAVVVEGRKPPLLEVRLRGSCGYFVPGRGD